MHGKAWHACALSSSSLEGNIGNLIVGPSSFPSTHLQIQVTVACNLLRMVVGWYYWCSPLTRAHPLIHVAETYYAWGLMLLLHAIRVRDTPHELPQSPGCRSHAACSARTCCSRPM